MMSPKKSQTDIKSKMEVKSCKNSNASNSGFKSTDKASPLSMLLIPPPPDNKGSLNRTGRSNKNEQK